VRRGADGMGKVVRGVVGGGECVVIGMVKWKR